MTQGGHQGRLWVWASIDVWQPGGPAALMKGVGLARSEAAVVVGRQPAAAVT
jgi:hypothetical protein